jgi:hypothetical protein
VRDFDVKRRDTNLVGLIRGLFPSKRLGQRQEMISRVGERPLALPRLSVEFFLPKFKRAAADVDFEVQLAQPLAGGTVVIHRGLAGQFKGALPHPIGEFCYVGWHSGEGGWVAFDARAQVAPEALQSRCDGVRGAGP